MPDLATSPAASGRTRSLLWCAMAGLVVGVVVYLAMRDQVPAITPAWLAGHPLLLALRASVADSLTAPLPSFLHAYAVLLSTAAVAGRGRLAVPALIASTVLCILLEAIQHPAIAATFTGIAGSSGIAGSLAHYAASGTFDPLDVAAILLAGAIVSIHPGVLHMRPPLPVRRFH